MREPPKRGEPGYEVAAAFDHVCIEAPISYRMKALRSYAHKLPYRDWLRRLKAEGMGIVERFIQRNDHLDFPEFEMKVQRMFLDLRKPTNWTLINQVLVNVNTAARLEKKK